ncbi:apoptosis facilitator Bcl-2-like protein 14 [Pholidichthys leucotaenia]
MASRPEEDVTEGGEEIFLLLEDYCNRRSQKKKKLFGSTWMSAGLQDDMVLDMFSRNEDEIGGHGKRAERGTAKHWTNLNRTENAVTDRLLQITESAPIHEVELRNQDDIIQRLVELMITQGDHIDRKIKQNPKLHQQLQNLTYDTFKRLTSSIQNLVEQTGSEQQIQQVQIAWAFEVTSRLSATGLVHQRRVLTFGERYIRENHAAWVQQHGGWVEALD